MKFFAYGFPNPIFKTIFYKVLIRSSTPHLILHRISKSFRKANHRTLYHIIRIYFILPRTDIITSFVMKSIITSKLHTFTARFVLTFRIVLSRSWIIVLIDWIHTVTKIIIELFFNRQMVIGLIKLGSQSTGLFHFFFSFCFCKSNRHVSFFLIFNIVVSWPSITFCIVIGLFFGRLD